MQNILIADDSATARMVIKRCLQIAGLQDASFREAGNGQQVLDALAEAPADLLVTDLTMPVMDGTELLRRVRADASLAGMKVLVISSAKNEAKERELLSMGAFAVLPKPVSPAMLAQTLTPFLPQTGGGAW
ncbi:MAG: response regulator [Desulfovibrionaceae bacterium]